MRHGVDSRGVLKCANGQNKRRTHKIKLYKTIVIVDVHRRFWHWGRRAGVKRTTPHPSGIRFCG